LILAGEDHDKVYTCSNILSFGNVDTRIQ
jgi:hypothetical protein